MELQGRVALITGASGGIGEALAYALADRGASVTLLARRTHDLDRVATIIGHDRALVTAGDVSQPADMLAAVAATETRFGGLDILINNAGVAVVGPLATMPLELMEQGWRVNVLGPILAAQAAIPALQRRGGGMIINVSSGMSMRPSPTMAIYSSSKAALNVVSASLREEVRDLGIHVMTVHPGLIANDFGANSLFSDDIDSTQRRETSTTRSERTSAHAAADIIAAIEADQPTSLHRPLPPTPPL